MPRIEDVIAGAERDYLSGAIRPPPRPPAKPVEEPSLLRRGASAIGGPIIGALESYDAYVLNVVQRPLLRAMESVLGFEAAQKERGFGTDINLIRAAQEGLKSIGAPQRVADIGGFVSGLGLEVVSDPLTWFTFGVGSEVRQGIRQVAGRARSVMSEAGIAIRNQTPRNILTVMEVASNPALDARIRDPNLLRAAQALRSEFSDPRNLNAAVKEARAGFNKAQSVLQETVNNLRRQGIPSSVAATMAERAPEVSAARLSAAEPLIRRRPPPSGVLGEGAERVATTVPERIRLGVAGPGFRFDLPFGLSRRAGLPSPEIRVLPREMAARASELIGRGAELAREAIPKSARETFTQAFRPLTRRLEDFSEIFEVSKARRATAETRDIRPAAQRVIETAERAGARTPEEITALLGKVSRGEASSPVERELAEALNRYNAVSLAAKRAAGVQERAFSAGFGAGRAAVTAREAGETIARTADEAASLAAKGDIAASVRTMRKVFEDALLSSATKPYPELGLTQRAASAIKSRAQRTISTVENLVKDIERLQAKRNRVASAMATIPVGRKMSEVVEGIPRVEAEEIPKFVSNIRSLLSTPPKTVEEIERAMLSIAVAAEGIRGAIGARRGLTGAVYRTIDTEIRPAIDQLDKTIVRLNAMRERGAISADQFERLSEIVRGVRGKILLTRTDLKRILSRTRAERFGEIRATGLASKVGRLERQIASLSERARKEVLGSAGKIVKFAQQMGRTKIATMRIAHRIALDAGFIVGTKEFNTFRKAVSEQLSGAMRHLKLQETVAGVFLADIGRSAFLTSRVPIQLAQAKRARGIVRLGGEAAGAPALFRVSPAFIRTLRTITPEMGNRIFRGEISLIDHLLSVGTRAPHQIEQAIRDYLNIRLSAMEAFGDPGSHMLMVFDGMGSAVAKSMEKVSPDLRLLFEEDGLSILARDIKRTGRQILNSQVLLRSVSLYQRLPPLEGGKNGFNISRAEWNRMLLSAGGPDEAVGLVLPSNVSSITAEFLTESEMSGLVSIVKSSDEGVRIPVGQTLHIIDRPVAEELIRTSSLFSDRNVVSRILLALDAFNNMWRRMVTIGVVLPAPAFNVRNVLSDMYMAAQAGVNPFGTSYLRGAYLAYMMKFRDKGWFKPILDQVWATDRLTGRTYTGLEIMEMSAWFGLAGRNVSVLSDISSRSAEMLRSKTAAGRAIDKASALINTIPESVADIGASWGRIGMLIDGIEGGLSPIRASLRTKASLYDYSQLTDFEREVLRQFIPFYTWIRNNVPRQFRALFETPPSVTVPFRVAGESLEQAGEDIPEWLSRKVPIIVASDEKTLKILSEKNFIPTADLDLFFRFLTSPSEASVEAMLENFGGAPRFLLEQSTNIDLWRSVYKGSLVPLERYPAELERLDLFGIRTPARLRSFIPRPISDINRFLQSQDASVISLLGIPLSEVNRDRLRQGIQRDLTEDKGNMAAAMRAAISRNDVQGFREAVRRIREIDARMIEVSGETRPPVAWRSPENMVNILADPGVTEETRREVLDEMARDVRPRRMALFGRKLARRLDENRNGE